MGGDRCRVATAGGVQGDVTVGEERTMSGSRLQISSGIERGKR